MTRHIKAWIALALTLALNFDVAAPMALAAAAKAQDPVSVGDDTKTYRVSAGDVVQISIFPVDEYSREVTVQPDGMVELALIGAVLVKGLTAHEIELLLAQKYARFVAEPKVTVNVRRFSGRRVAIIGEVHSPGYYEYRDGMRILELIATAGGLTDLATPSSTRIFRLGGATPEVVPVNVRALFNGKLERNVLLAPGDTILLPKSTLTRNTIWINANILPWLTLMTLVSSTVILIKQ